MQTAVDPPQMRTPPGPRGWPLLGSAPSFARDPLGFLLDIARRYGDVARIQLGPNYFYLVNRPELVEDVLITRRHIVPKEAYERWLDGSAERLPKFAYFPFGGGPRLCIGAGFAAMEGVLLLALVAQRYRLRPVPGTPIEMQPSLTLRPKSGVWMTLQQHTA